MNEVQKQLKKVDTVSGAIAVLKDWYKVSQSNIPFPIEMLEVIERNIALAAGVTLDSELTGLTAGTNTPIAATDTILEAFANLQAQIDALP